MKYTGFLDKQSLNLTARNPLKKDETIIDYEMDSEEEWNELNGEDLDGKKEDEQEEEDDEEQKMLAQQDEEEGFIVPDDYLSVSELNLSQADGDSQKIQDQLEERKQNMLIKTAQPAHNLQPFMIVLEYAQLDKKK